MNIRKRIAKMTAALVAATLLSAVLLAMGCADGRDDRGAALLASDQHDHKIPYNTEWLDSILRPKEKGAEAPG